MRDRPQTGSVLLLVPAAVFVLVVLSAIAVDFSLAFLGQRELTNAAAAAANDAAAAAVSDAAFYGSAAGPVVLDPARAEHAAATSVGRRRPGGVVVTGVTTRVAGAHVCVAVVGEVPYIFAPVVPGLPRSAVVRGRAVATAAVGGPGATVSSSNIFC